MNVRAYALTLHFFSCPVSAAVLPNPPQGFSNWVSGILEVTPIRMATNDARIKTYRKLASVGVFHQALQEIGLRDIRCPAYFRIRTTSLIADRIVGHAPRKSIEHAHQFLVLWQPPSIMTPMEPERSTERTNQAGTDYWRGIKLDSRDLQADHLGQCSVRSCPQGGASTVDVEEKEHVHLYTASTMSGHLPALSMTARRV